MKKPIYLDYNSTTPLDPRVLKAMTPYFLTQFGNPASLTHMYGWEANEAVEEARASIVKGLGGKDKRNLIFTSGATESNNLVIKGIVEASELKPAHVITQKTEHKCILDSCKEIQKQGHEVTYLDVDQNGLVNPDQVRSSIKKNTILCSVMAANNEVGTIQPLREISKICHEKGVLFHTDAVQAVGKIPLNVERDGIDLLSLSAHKIYGPKGIGALYIASRIPPISLSPQLQGGGQERGKRSGTLNVPGIVGLAKAFELCLKELPQEQRRLSKLRDSFIKSIQKRIEGVHLNGHPTQRIPNNINLSFDFVKSDELIPSVPEIAIASGSACTSGSSEPSYVLQAMFQDKERVDTAIRLGFGRWTTQKEIDRTLDSLERAVKKLRKASLSYEMALQMKSKGLS